MAAKKETLKSERKYPWSETVDGHEITFRLAEGKDKKAALAFTRTLSHDDILFLQMDITKPEVIEESLNNVKRGRAIIVLAEEKGKVVGYASLFHNEMLWTRHQGEIRIFVKDSLRGIGLGRRLASEAVQIAHEQNLDLIVVNIPREQPHVRAMLEHMGFTVEALLTDWLMDQEGNTHDLIIMSHHVRDF